MKLINTKYLPLFFLTIVTLSIVSCQKQDEWLDVKRNKSDVVPETLQDFQAILDNTTSLNNNFSAGGTMGTDDFYLPDANLTAAAEPERNLYLWNKDIWINDTSFDWNTYYTMVEYANVVLDGIKKLSSNSAEYNNIKGQALFWRAFAHYQLSQVFCKPYSEGTAETDLGLPIRTSSDVNIIFQRSSVKMTYSQITNDLLEAISILPSNAKYITRPIKAAALTFLARVYLNMDNYDQALIYADLSLKEKSIILDFNSGIISTSVTYRFPADGSNNPEILFFAKGGGYNSILPSTGGTAIVDPLLYNSYDSDDLRKTYYYINSGTNQYKIRGTYSGSNTQFFGIATNETYLIRAECYARMGKTVEAMLDLNYLLKNRYKTNQFTPLIATSSDDALRIILRERRKELAFVGNIRWQDLRRLNKDLRFAKTITRVASGINYTLLPNALRYVFPIPENEIRLTGIEQNLR